MSDSSRRRRRGAGNRERVLAGTIELMNRQGCGVGTAQIADYCDISPGNLYYHFRNREEILREIFARLEADLAAVLQAEPGETIDATRLAGFYCAGAEVLWRYRFLFASATEFIFRDSRLANEYRDFSRASIEQIHRIIELVVAQQPGPIALDAGDMLAMAENKWVLWIAWPRYTELRAGDGAVTEGDFARGLEQIFSLLAPYLEVGYRKRTGTAIHRFVEQLQQDFLATG